jgi:hypothetical protein
MMSSVTQDKPLTMVADGEGAQVQALLLRRFRGGVLSRNAPGQPARTAAQLWAVAGAHKTARGEAEAENRRAGEERLAAARAAEYSKRLDQLATRAEAAWQEVADLIGILAAGYLQADSVVDRTSALQVEAGDLGVKANRKRHPVTVAPFGCVADYVPFYFAPRSPMPYVIWRGRVPTYVEGQEPLVYFRFRLRPIAEISPWGPSRQLQPVPDDLAEFMSSDAGDWASPEEAQAEAAAEWYGSHVLDMGYIRCPPLSGGGGEPSTAATTRSWHGSTDP